MTVQKTMPHVSLMCYLNKNTLAEKERQSGNLIDMGLCKTWRLQLDFFLGKPSFPKVAEMLLQ